MPKHNFCLLKCNDFRSLLVMLFKNCFTHYRDRGEPSLIGTTSSSNSSSSKGVCT
jgi:hypothetical protein